MNSYLDRFSRAYQGELLRSTGKTHANSTALKKLQADHDPSIALVRFSSLVGSLLIGLGERMKGQTPCPEMVEGQA